MPFEQPIPRALTLQSVCFYAPTTSGIYGMSNAREWIYIGETDNIQGTLLSHLQELTTSVMIQRPTGFVFEICDRARRTSRQDRLVLEYKPTSNQHSWR